MSTATKYNDRQATTALCFKDARYKFAGHISNRIGPSPVSLADALSDDMLFMGESP